MGPRVGLDRCEKSRPPTGIRSPDRPARSQSLYRLGYPAHNTSQNQGEIGIYKTMRMNLIRIHKTAVMRSHNTKQWLMQKHVIVMHVYLHFSESLKCHIRYTDSCFEFNTGVDTQIQRPSLGRGSITATNAVLCDKPTTLSEGTKELPCIAQ